jgi:hypothetical protein
MMDTARPATSSTKPFAIGLAVGLLVGGLAGAFIGGLSEPGISSIKTAPTRPGVVQPPRDERPAATGPTEAIPDPAPTQAVPASSPK